MRFFGLKNCDTCKKALRELSEAGLSPIVVDVRQDGVSRDDLETFQDEFGEALVNKRSTTWRNFTDDQKGRDPLELLTDYPTLMKRPVIEMDDGKRFLGWSKPVQEAVFP